MVEVVGMGRQAWCSTVFHRRDILARFTDGELDLVGRQRDPSPLLSYLPGCNLDGNQLYGQPVARIKYDGSRWFPTSFVDSTPPKKGVLPTIRITILGSQGYRLLSECVPAFFLSERAGLEIADFPQSMEVFGSNLAWGLVVRGDELWIDVPKGSDKFLVQVDKPPRGRCQTRPERNSTEAPRASFPGIRHAVWHTFPGKGLHPEICCKPLIFYQSVRDSKTEDL